MRKLLLTLLILLASCAPSVESIQQTIAPIPANTPNLPALEADYITRYIAKLDEWLENFQRWDATNDPISTEGISLLDDPAFKEKLVNSSAELERSAKEIAELTPPSDKLKPYQAKAEALHAHTQTINSMYLPAVSGSNAAADSFFAALDRVSATYLDIIAVLKRDKYLPP
jgi:hypothetical protein